MERQASPAWQGWAERVSMLSGPAVSAGLEWWAGHCARSSASKAQRGTDASTAPDSGASGFS